MSTDNFKQVYFNDGEGLVHTDLRDVQMMLESKIWDQIVHNQMGALGLAPADFGIGYNGNDHVFGGADGTDHHTTRAYCLNPGAAFLKQGSTNAKIAIAPGVLLQKIGTITGDDPKCIAYTFTGAEEWTLTNGDATNPRVDLLQMKLEYVLGDSQSRDFEDATTRIVTTTSMSKKRRVQCTLLVKTGTPGASPAIPAVDAGYVPVGMVMVGNGWTTAGNAPIFGEDTVALNNAVVHDQRMPVKIRAYRCPASQFILVTGWTYAVATGMANWTNATNELNAVCPHTPNGRLIGVQVTFLTGVGGLTGQTLAKRSVGPTTIAVSSRATLANQTPSNMTSDCVSFQTFEANHSPSAGPIITASGSAFGRIGVPLWTNGRHCPVEAQRTVVSPRGYDSLIYRVVNVAGSGSNPSVQEVIFYVAEGM